MIRANIQYRERDIEAYFRKQVAKKGGLALKFVSPTFTGVPDRIVFWKTGYIEFVELKAPGRKPTERQRRVHALFETLGHKVTVLDSHIAVDQWIVGWRP